MWKKHPATKISMGLIVLIVLGLALIFCWPLLLDFWADGQTLPLTSEGVVSFKNNSGLHNRGGRFEIQISGGTIQHFEVNPQIYDSLKLGNTVEIFFSPRLFHVYAIRVFPGEVIFRQDNFIPGQFLQSWQEPFAGMAAVLALIFCGVFCFCLVCLADLLLPLKYIKGWVVARVEQADNKAAGFVLVLRTRLPDGQYSRSFKSRTLRFEVSKSDFLASDQAEFVEVHCTPIFKYVKKLETLTLLDLTKNEECFFPKEYREGLHYLTGWQLKMVFFKDLILAFIFFGLALFILISQIPLWQKEGYGTELQDWQLQTGGALIALGVGSLVGANFLRKLRDYKAPRKLTAGPVLSKWRVTGVTNDIRRQIVVANGGVKSGKEGVRKFEVDSLLFDELKEGDIVEIEHSPKLHYIFRLEVKGHFEFSKPF